MERGGIYTRADFLLLKCMVNRSMEERKVKNTCLGLRNTKRQEKEVRRQGVKVQLKDLGNVLYYRSVGRKYGQDSIVLETFRVSTCCLSSP